MRENDLDLLTGNGRIQEGSSVHYRNMRTRLDSVIARNIFDDEEFEEIAGMMDIENFTDYFISQIFFNNTDWPGNNIDFWRYSGEPDPTIPEKDGRWRWLMYDTDFGFGLSGGANAARHDMIAFATNAEPNPPRAAQSPWATLIFRALLVNQDYRDFFVIRFSDLLNSNFLAERATTVLHEMKEVVAPEMMRHQQRWKHPVSRNTWHSNVDVMRTFAERRPDNVREHKKTFFELDTLITLQLDVESPNGSVSVNTLEINESLPGVGESVFPWNGIYFSGIPLTLSAKPDDNFLFKGWTINGDFFADSTLTLYPEADKEVIAHFGNVPTSTENDPELPGKVSLGQNYPNPFNPATVIRYQLPQSSEVRLEVFDILGRRVSTLTNESMNAGTHEVTFDASALASGVYIYRLEVRPLHDNSPPTVLNKKMTLIK